jgi:hypothetical protein
MFALEQLLRQTSRRSLSIPTEGTTSDFMLTSNWSCLGDRGMGFGLGFGFGFGFGFGIPG